MAAIKTSSLVLFCIELLESPGNWRIRSREVRRYERRFDEIPEYQVYRIIAFESLEIHLLYSFTVLLIHNSRSVCLIGSVVLICT